MANKVDYFEIGSADPVASRDFYGKLFGWDIAAEPSDQGYRMINEIEGGIWDTSKLGGGWGIFYVHVDDVREAIEKAKELGAKVAIPFSEGGGIEFAHLIDPQGNRFGVWRPVS